MFRISICFLCASFCWSSQLADEKNELEFRIRNGHWAEQGQFPWHAHVISRYQDKNGRCGGSIIGQKWILTAAHCIHGAAAVDIITGSINLDEGPLSPAQQWILHEQYIHPSAVDDIGVIELENPLVFNENTQPINLHFETVCPNLLIRATGRGVTEHNEFTHLLQYIDLVTITNDECQSFYGSGITDGLFCAKSGTPDIVKVLCSGDSGAPAVIDIDAKPVQVGVFSAGSPEACGDSPNIFTRISNYGNWILLKTGI